LCLALALSMVTAVPSAQAVGEPYLLLPFDCGTSWTGTTSSTAHRSYEIDFNLSSGAEDRGKPVKAAAAGTIRWEGGASSAYGNYLEIDHGNGFSTLYAHLQDKMAHDGDVVQQGEKIGTVGDTDDTAGLRPHLHFEFRNRGDYPSYPGYIRPASFQGDPFDYATGTETYVSQNCGSTNTPTLPGLSTISRAPGSLDVFATTSDGRLKHRNLTNGVWSCWSILYGNATIKGDPAAIASGPGRIDVFAQGIDNRLKKLTWTSANGWYPWADLGTYIITSSPAVTSRSATGIDVFAKNAENKIVYRHFEIGQSAWTTNWSNIGDNAATTTATSAPAAVASADGTRMNVFARANDGSLLSLMWTSAAGWYNWADRGGSITGRPSASTRAGYSVDLFLRDHDNSLIHRYSPDGADWTTFPPSDFGGWITTSPTAVSWNNQRIDVFTRNSAADLIQKTWTSAYGWYAWSGRGPVGAPAC
jgi:hypothetical protein